MKFDVIIGNPPYQLETGSSGAQATPLYHKFIEKAIDMSPKYVSMIVPSRWFFGGMGLSEFRKKMIKDKRLKEIVDYESSLALFNNVEVNGGINYFLWGKKYNGKCKVTHIRANGKKYESNRFLAYKDLDVFINDNTLFEIIKRNKLYESKDTFEKLVSSRGPYGWKLNSKISLNKTSDDVIIYGFKRKGFVNKNLIKDNKQKYEYKIFISLAYGGNRQVLNKPFIPEKTLYAVRHIYLLAHSKVKMKQ